MNREGLDRVIQSLDAGDTLVHKHPDFQAIATTIVEWCSEAEATRPPFTIVAQEIVDLYAQDGSLGTNPTQVLARFRDSYVAEKLALGATWMARGALQAGLDLNLLRQHGETLKQHDKTLAVIDKALEVAEARVVNTNGEEGTTNLTNLLERREAVLAKRESTLKSILELQMILGNVEDQRVQKSMNLNVKQEVDRDTARDIMMKARKGRPKPIDVGEGSQP